MAGSRICAAVLLAQAALASAANCDYLTKAKLPPGFWEPAFIYRSLQLSLESLGAPPPNSQVMLDGLCDGNGLMSHDFQWEKPTNDGGDWIAKTSNSLISLSVGNDVCFLSAVAVTTVGWPALRLQFEHCLGKAAVEVPLFKKDGGGLKLVDWMCTVSLGSDLCAKAKQIQSNGTAAVDSLPIQDLLDVKGVAEAASKGVTHTIAKSECFQEVHWFSVPVGIGVDAAEWDMLSALRQVIAPPVYPKVSIPAAVQVEETCFLSCAGTWEDKCGKLPPASTTPALPTLPREIAPAQVIWSAPLSGERLQKFGQALADPEVSPWVWLSLFFAFASGAVVALCCLPLCRGRQDVARLGPTRVQQVQVQYPDAVTSTAFLR